MEGRWEGYVHYIEFSIGDTIVYPCHGAAKIENIIEREPNGETAQYLVLQILQSDLNIQVSAKNAELVGVRNVVGEKELLEIFPVLRETDVEEVGNWSRRYKANQERLDSGDINKVTEVVHSLWHRDRDRGLSADERRMLNEACQVPVGEFALADDVDGAEVEEAFTRVDATIERRRALAQEGATGKKKDEADDKSMNLDANA